MIYLFIELDPKRCSAFQVLQRAVFLPLLPAFSLKHTLNIITTVKFLSLVIFHLVTRLKFLLWNNAFIEEAPLLQQIQYPSYDSEVSSSPTAKKIINSCQHFDYNVLVSRAPKIVVETLATVDDLLCCSSGWNWRNFTIMNSSSQSRESLNISQLVRQSCYKMLLSI